MKYFQNYEEKIQLLGAQNWRMVKDFGLLLSTMTSSLYPKTQKSLVQIECTEVLVLKQRRPVAYARLLEERGYKMSLRI